jgi:hypothetical protein
MGRVFFSSVMDRGNLIADLGQATLPDSAPSVLVVLGFVGLNDYLETVGVLDDDSLLERLRGRLGQAVGAGGRVYEPRRGEFCLLIEGGLGPDWLAIPAALDEETRMVGLHTSLAIVALPEEADTPSYALRLADQRLRAQNGVLRPPPRQ